MPLTTYCGHCAGKNEYTAPKPRFCGHCGKPLDSAFASVQVPNISTRYSAPPEDEESRAAREVAEIAARISSSDIIVHGWQPSSVSIGELAANPGASLRPGIHAQEQERPPRKN